MKRIGIGLLHLAVVGMAAGSFMGESMAGNRYRASAQTRDACCPQEASRGADASTQLEIWDEETSAGLKPERWVVWRHRWGGLSVGACVLALFLWRSLRTEAAAISLLLSASLTLLSVLMWFALG